ncbi:MAG: hypothetical protein KDI71_10270 [Xanthomonadales bacterium]|nr:hypothetical protein [Xanthomonadales bacterium]
MTVPVYLFAVAGTSPLTESDKERFRVLVAEALASEDANQKQYDDVIMRLDADPCRNVDVLVSKEEERELENALSESFSLASVDVFSTFQFGSWFVIYSDISPGDPTYGFFPSDPRQGGEPIKFWAGGDAFYAVGDIAEWTIANVPGVPEELAECFAWSLTMGSE